MSGAQSSVRNPMFRTSIDKLFNNWQALTIAVENGQGGGYGKEIALWMRQSVEDFFYQNDDLDGDEVSEFVGTMMNQELDTIVDDNSLEQLGEALVQHFRLATSGKTLDLQVLHNALDQEASKPKPAPSRQPNDDESSDDDEDDEAMEVDSADTSATTGAPSQEESPGPSNHRAGKNFVSEPDDDGWVTVTKSKKH